MGISEDRLRSAATRGASSTTDSWQVVQDAAEAALQAFHLAVWRGREITDPQARVREAAANIAKDLARDLAECERFSECGLDPEALAASPSDGSAGEAKELLVAEVRKLLRRHAARSLTPLQRQAVLLVLAGHSLATAARKARTDTSSFLKRFNRAVTKLREACSSQGGDLLVVPPSTEGRHDNRINPNPRRFP